MSSPADLLDTWTRPDRWPLAAAVGSGLILTGAYAFEIFGDYPPCPLCVAQRWVHIWIIVAGVIGFLAAMVLRRPDAQLVKTGASTMRGWFRTRLQALYALYQAPGALARLGCTVIAGLAGWSFWEAARHAGMEYGFWTIDCQPANAAGVTVDTLLNSLSTAQNVVPCDEAAWTLLGVSMAGYNALFSAALCLISIITIFRGPSWRPDL